MRTIYKIRDERKEVTYTEDTDEADSYSRMGMTVTATTGTRQ